MPGILCYFQPVFSLPTAAGTGIGEAATREANYAVKCVITEVRNITLRSAHMQPKQQPFCTEVIYA